MLIEMTLPLARTSPLRISRRDIVLNDGDDLRLDLAVVDTDAADAIPVDLSPVGTTLQMLVWHASTWRDYGLPMLTGRRTLYTGTATMIDAVNGRATVSLGSDAGRMWPQRVGYTLQMTLGGARSAIGWGALHLPGGCG